jgi:hypothetical protein
MAGTLAAGPNFCLLFAVRVSFKIDDDSAFFSTSEELLLSIKGFIGVEPLLGRGIEVL